MALQLRRVELFAALEPADLERVAAIAEERSFGDGAVIAEEGELGDELYVILDGRVQVARDDGSTLARRGPGDVIGELSLLRRSPRMASLIADGDVRAIGIQQLAFEGMIRDRPEIALAIMRMLADRLTAASSPT
jgi:CRP-like cAMP-binding protein